MDPEAPLPAVAESISYKKNEPPKPSHPRFIFREWQQRWDAVPDAVYEAMLREGVDAVLEPGSLEWRREFVEIAPRELPEVFYRGKGH